MVSNVKTQEPAYWLWLWTEFHRLEAESVVYIYSYHIDTFCSGFDGKCVCFQ